MKKKRTRALGLAVSHSSTECASCSCTSCSFHTIKPLTHVIGRIGNYTLEPDAPISAICWYDDMRNPEKPKGLHISVFTRTNKYPEAVSRISYSPHQGWDATTDLVATIYHTSTGVSAIGACQVSENKKGAISVFYQPEAQVIDLKPVAIGAARVRQAEIAAVVLPKGIPTVR